MPKVSQFYRQQRLTPLSGVGNLSASDIAAATQGNRDAIKSGEAITEVGIRFMEQKEKAEFHNQLNTARTEYLTKFFNYEQDLQTNADTETYIPNLKAGQTSSFKFTNKRAANEFELWKANEDLSQTRRVFGAKNDRDVKNYTDNWNLGIKEATRRTASAVSESDYQLELANGLDYFGLEYATEDKDGEPIPVLDKKGEPKIQLIEDWENPLLDTDEVRMAGYKSWKADADAKRKVIMNGNAVGIGFAVWEASVTEEDPDGDLTAGFKAIRENPNVSEGDKQEVESELKTRVHNQRAENKLELEQETAKSIETVDSWINDGDFVNIETRIDDLPITSGEKLRQKKKVSDYIEAVNKANTKVGFVTSDETNIKIDSIITRVRNGELSYEEGIGEYKGLAKGVKSTEGSKNLNDIRTAADAADIKKSPELDRPASKRAQSAISRVRAIDIRLAVEGAKTGDEVIAATAQEGKYLRIQNDIDDWILENKDDPNFDVTLKAKTEELLTPVVEDVSLNWLETILSPTPGGVPFFSAAAATLLRTEGEELAQERKQAMKKESVFKVLTDEEQERVLLKIDSGKSGQQAISEVRQRMGGGAGGSFEAPDPIEEVVEEQPIPVKTKAEYDKLPRGTKYVDKNGNVGVKR